MAELDIRHIDQRTVERYLRRGEISQKDYEKYLKELPDLEEDAMLIRIEQPQSEKKSAD